MYYIPNLKYKTTLCQKWLDNQQCQKGVNCYFAHGEFELRNIDQNQYFVSHQNQTSFAYTQLFNLPSNYKTIRCKFFAKGKCQLGQNCTFFHGQSDRRSKIPIVEIDTAPTFTNFGGMQQIYENDNGYSQYYLNQQQYPEYYDTSMTIPQGQNNYSQEENVYEYNQIPKIQISQEKFEDSNEQQKIPKMTSSIDTNQSIEKCLEKMTI